MMSTPEPRTGDTDILAGSLAKTFSAPPAPCRLQRQPRPWTLDFRPAGAAGIMRTTNERTCHRSRKDRVPLLGRPLAASRIVLFPVMARHSGMLPAGSP